MPYHTDLILGAVLNMIVFSALIYGSLARSKGRALAAKFAICAPALFNFAVCIFKRSLDFEMRVVGMTATLLAALTLYLLARSKGLFDGQPT